MNKKKYMVLTVVSIIAFILITIGVTYSFFSYIGMGSTENTVESGSIKFIYEEINKMGNGIKIEDAFPVDDSEGKTSSNYFDFKVTSTTAETVTIPYEITARIVEGSDDLSDYVKVYLTKVNGNSEQEKVLSIYSDLPDSTNTLASRHNDKTLYTDEIPSGARDYTENYRLRMWLNNDSNDGSVLDYSPVFECSDSQYTNESDCRANNGVWNPTENYNNQNKTFAIRINVYANGEQATNEKIITASSTGIKDLLVNDVDANEAEEDKTYDFYKIVEEDVTQAEIEVEPENPNATVTVENITGQAFNTSVQRLATVKLFDLVNGDNFFRITITSANRKNSESYILKVRVGEDAGLYASDGRQLASWQELAENGMNETTCAGANSAINAVRNGETDLRLIISKNATSVAGGAFTSNSYIKSVVIPGTVTIIGTDSFRGMTKLTNVTFGEGITEIGLRSFSGDTALTSVNIPGSVTRVVSSAFSGCTSLASVTLNEGLTTIGEYGFKNTAISEITFPSTLTTVSTEAFNNCSNLKTLTYMEGTTTTPALNKAYLTAVTKVNLPSTLTSIGDSSFSGFKALTDITIPNGVTSIGASAFNGTSALSSITIPNSVTTIGGSAFQNSGLTSLTIPGSVKVISTDSFRGMSKLASLTLGNGIQEIGLRSFNSDTALTSVTIPASVTKIVAGTFGGCTNLTSVTFTDPTGWKSGNTSLDLSNPTQNATYIKSTYTSNNWLKSN